MAKGESKSKSYTPAEHERRIFQLWQEGGYFHPSPDDRPPEKRFSMVIPPPNVTGALHLGHALNNTLQDILVRRKRMAGCNAFWLVGTDHAGIATQATVEKTIRKEEGKSRHDLGRDELVKRIWQWKEKFGGRIVEQLKLMGCSCDYDRERFTLDDGCAKAVRETFFKMFRDGLIYRGKRLVNWDTQLQTAVADDEVYHEQVKGHFYYFKYPILRSDETNQPEAQARATAQNKPDAQARALQSDAQARAIARAAAPTARLGEDYLLIATTRPETMLADTAVAVHPEPDAALEVAETQLQVKLREASEKERPAIEAQLSDISDRKANLLSTLMKLRDMAKSGRRALLPLVNREIPLVCDEWADPALGTGCVKITPAHDMNDYEVGQRHHLPIVNMMTPDGHVNENGGPYKGMKLADARKKVVEDLEKLGLVEKIEDRLIDLAHSDRSNTPIEPYLSDQWFVKMGDLTEEEAARIQTPFLKDYIARARSESHESEPGAQATGSAGVPPAFSAPRPGVSAPRPDITEPRPDITEPRPDITEPRPDITEPRPDITEPRPSGSGFETNPKNPLADARGSEEKNPLPDGRGSEKKLPGLAQMAMDALTRGEFRFHPARYEKTYLDWLGEKRDWCISRQLWWGHRVPVWEANLAPHAVDGSNSKDRRQNQMKSLADLQAALNSLTSALSIASEFEIKHFELDPISKCRICVRTVAGDKLLRGVMSMDSAREVALGEPDQLAQTPFAHIPQAREAARQVCNLLNMSSVKQDLDVLDTWFSSALWPHSTMGWPQSEPRPGFTEPRPSGSGFESNPKNPLADARGSEKHATYARGAEEKNPLADARGSERHAAGSLNLLDYYYPTSVLSTAREIITLWVARMVITGLYNMGKVPFRDVVIHPVIQDGQGRKMSKTLGNGVDPVDIIEEYGADALRYTLAELATETQDIRLPVKPKKLPDGRTINISEKFEKGRNFCNKLWQAATGFVIPNLDGYDPRPLDPAKLHEFDRWILSRMTACIETVNEALERYRFSEAVGAAYRFMWDEYCSWYIEMTKPRLAGSDRAAAQQVLAHVLDQLLRVLHPVIPFITEAIWAELNKAAPARGLREVAAAEPMLVAAKWPAGDASLRDESVEREVAVIHDVIRSVRDIRTVVSGFRGKAGQPSLRSLPSVRVRAASETAKMLKPYADFMCPLAGCDVLEIGAELEKPGGAMSRVCGQIEVYAPVGDLVDLAAVKQADQARVEELRAALVREEVRLSKPDFVDRADPAVVEATRARAAELSSQIRALESHLADLG